METTKGKYNFRSFLPGDEKGILKLWKTAFKADMAEEFFKWKYLDNPFNKSMMLCVAQNSEIVTFYGGIPFKFQYKDKTVQAVHLMDIMSHPGHRQHKVFEKTARKFMTYFCTPDSLLLMYGFPGKVHYSIGRKILNYEKISKISYFKAFSEKSACKENASEKELLFLEPVTDTKDMAKKIDLVWEKNRKFYPFSIIRDADFVRWRYFNHPDKQYHILGFLNSEAGLAQAWAVLALKEKKAVLVDMVAPDKLDLFRQIIKLTGSYLSERGIEQIETWLPENHFLASHAAACGFEEQNEPLGIIPTVSLFEHSPSQKWLKSNLYYNMGDGDLF